MRASGRMRTRRNRVNESAVDNLGRGSGACLVVNVHPPRSFEVFKSLAKLHVPAPSTAILSTRLCQATLAPPPASSWATFLPSVGKKARGARRMKDFAVGV